MDIDWEDHRRPVWAVDGKDARELRRALGVHRPVLDHREMHLEPELSEVPAGGEQVGREELAAVGEPVDEHLVDRVGVDAGLRPHVAGLEERAAPDVLHSFADRVMHLVLRLRV